MERTLAPGPPAMSGVPGGMGPAPFVGRERELAELRGAFDAARTGRGAFYLVSGEPGIGKTRLAEQAAADAAARGFSVLWGRCWESGGAPAYWPWVQVLRAALRGRDHETLRRDAGHALAHLGQLVPEMAQEPPPDHEGQPIKGLALNGRDEARLLLFDAVQTIVGALAADRPLAVMLDDLHAADEASLLLLQYLSRQLQQAQVLILGTHRDWEMRSAPALRRLLGGLALVIAGHQDADGRPVLHRHGMVERAQSIAATVGSLGRMVTEFQQPDIAGQEGKQKQGRRNDLSHCGSSI